MSASANLPSADPRISTASRRKSTANLSHSTTYLRENVGLLDSIIASDQQIANGNHILTGRVDLVIDNHGSHEPIDFKSGHRPQNDSRAMVTYARSPFTLTSWPATQAAAGRETAPLLDSRAHQGHRPTVVSERKPSHGRRHDPRERDRQADPGARLHRSPAAAPVGLPELQPAHALPARRHLAAIANQTNSPTGLTESRRHPPLLHSPSTTLFRRKAEGEAC